MTKIFSTFVIGLLSFQASAIELGYLCFPIDRADAPSIEKLELPEYMKTIEIFRVAPKACGSISIMIYKDQCYVNGHQIVIGLHGFDSFIKTKAGKKYALHCEKEKEVFPMPSHGGSN